jgi:hypothetical protein
MQPIVSNLAALAVALLFYLWRSHCQSLRQRVLRQRVAHMLWIMAEQVEEPDLSFSGHGHG